MKKLLSLTLAACATAGLTFLLNGCDGLGATSGDSNPDSNVESSLDSNAESSLDNSELSSEAHEHDFATEWTKDETHHWRACFGDCEEITEKGDHTYDETTDDEGKITKICTVCQHTVIIVPEHEHTYEGEWTFDENGHWKVCDTQDCGEKLQGEHNLMQETTHGADYIETTYTCDVCAYTYKDRITIETVVPDEKTWIDAFNSLTYTNYTVHAEFGSDSYHFDNKVEITETAAHYLIGGYFHNSPVGENEYYVMHEYYTILQADGTYNTYIREDNSAQYMLLDDHTNIWYVNARMESLLALKYDEHYEKFTYNEETGTYVCPSVITTDYHPNPSDPEYNIPVHCKNTEIKVADGAIIYIASDYVVAPEYNGDNFDSKLLYDNISLTVVTLPSGIDGNTLPDDGRYDDYNESTENNPENNPENDPISSNE